MQQGIASDAGRRAMELRLAKFMLVIPEISR
jgi:hypothetical protein